MEPATSKECTDSSWPTDIPFNLRDAIKSPTLIQVILGNPKAKRINEKDENKHPRVALIKIQAESLKGRLRPSPSHEPNDHHKAAKAAKRRSRTR